MLILRGPACDYKYQGDCFSFHLMQMLWQQVFLLMKIYFWFTLILKIQLLGVTAFCKVFLLDSSLSVWLCTWSPIYCVPTEDKIRGHQGLTENDRSWPQGSLIFWKSCFHCDFGSCALLSFIPNMWHILNIYIFKYFVHILVIFNVIFAQVFSILPSPVSLPFIIYSFFLKMY